MNLANIEFEQQRIAAAFQLPGEWQHHDQGDMEAFDLGDVQVLRKQGALAFIHLIIPSDLLTVTGEGEIHFKCHKNSG